MFSFLREFIRLQPTEGGRLWSSAAVSQPLSEENTTASNILFFLVPKKPQNHEISPLSLSNFSFRTQKNIQHLPASQKSGSSLGQRWLWGRGGGAAAPRQLTLINK